MKDHGSTLSVWVSEMSRALHVLGSVLRCQIPLIGLQLLDRGQRGIQMTARIEISEFERERLTRRLESIVGVLQVRVLPEQEVPPVLVTPMDWNSIAARGARFR
jgi:hypothetical protein